MPCKRLSYSAPGDWPAIGDWLARRKSPEGDVAATVRAILDDVRERGDAALAEYTRKFDCPDFRAEALTVSGEAIAAALDEIPAADADILREAIANVRRFHENQSEKSWLTTSPDGTILGQLVLPVERVGLYVPGGQGGETPLISSLIMNAVPAQVAGVPEIAVVSPPRKDGTLNPYILATAHLLGLTELHLCGSAWGIAGLAYGTESIRPCHVIAGPGNIFVATAKTLLIGEIGIDMVAGPSEVTILADDSANPAWVAADMLSQAEHDPLAASLLVTPSAELAGAVCGELKRQAALLPRAAIASRSLSDWGAAILVPDLDTGMELVNRIAPEHFELAVADPWAHLGKVRNAGAVIMGHHSPEPVGDYFAGPNHVLPTVGTARFSSALSVQNFCKKSSVVATSEAYVREHAAKIARLARLEGLEAHARSVECRTEKP